jgi:hypothetical protein
MPDHVRQRVFEPFFTTKTAGKGSGLGLAITYGVIRAHHGTVHLQSGPNAGTVFTIDLPLRGVTSQPADEVPNAGSQTGPRLALIALDDAAARTWARDAARAAGYTTIELASPADAPAVLAARPGRFSLSVVQSLQDRDFCAALLHAHPRLKLVALDTCGPAQASSAAALASPAN